ncbi:hypothetical protein AAFF_G00012120 [Aldrovandia affinis]|uniref:Zinc finger CCCH domain-containing protein 14 n=1 Tax=Aldrovandia affinis TaxID=143900 RepID=A0AAD7S6K6_9TELE|nr:hypothetical protein AAFF_G00012120 [Aldrovandia affinis]
MESMEIGTHTRKKIRAAIKRKLQELGSYVGVDEELPDYIMVLVANKKNAQQMAEDLNVFLGHNSIKFTLWLHEVLEKLHSVAVEPALLRPKCLQADVNVSIGSGQEQGQAKRRGGELQALTLCRLHGMEARNSTSPTLENHISSDRKGYTEKSLQGVVFEAQPLMEPLYNNADFRIKPGLSEAGAAAFTQKPGQRSEVTIPFGSSWPSQATGQPRDRYQASDGMHGYRPTAALQSAGQPLYLYSRLQDSFSERDKATMPSVDIETREEAVSRRWKPELVSSMGHRSCNTVSEVGEPNNAGHFSPSLRPQEVGSAISTLVTMVRKEVLAPPPRVAQARCRKTRSKGGVDPKFIVTLEGVPSSLKNLKYDNSDVGGGERETLCSNEEEESVPVKRHKAPERCRFWPMCESRDECSYHHPTTQCKNFPRCNFGDKCLFIHPNCKFDGQCTKVDCPYAHSSQRDSTSLSTLETSLPTDLCHFFPECKKMDCQFYHPKPCRFATQCKRLNG